MLQMDRGGASWPAWAVGTESVARKTARMKMAVKRGRAGGRGGETLRCG